MFYTEINIWDNFSGDIKGKAKLKVYIADLSPEIDISRKNPAVLICPGGGYRFVSDRESEPVALALLGQGFNVFTLTYEVGAHIRHPQPLLDISRAMCIIRENAMDWHTDPNKIAVCGFSAGGHLAASLGVFWKEDYIHQALGTESEMNKPNALILCYPVITSKIGKAHRDSFYKLLGENLSEENYEQMSLEKYVGKHTPPTFIWHTFDDKSVPADNALLFAQSLKDNLIPFELHIFPSGNHGLSLCDERTTASDHMMNRYVGRWFDMCVQWLKNYAFK